MVEFPFFPAARVMALLAARTEPLFMVIVLRMTGRASGLGVLEQGAFMTFLAFDTGVFFAQRKRRFIVIE